MNTTSPHTNPNGPFGAETQRPRWPLILLAGAYVVWLAILIWMAMYHTAR